MLLLPKKVGAFTLTRKLGTGGVAESYVGVNEQSGRAVVVRRILPFILRDPSRLAAIEARVVDLIGVRHPFLVQVLEHVKEGDEHFIVEEHIDGVNLEKVLNWCRQGGRSFPHNVFLNIATQVCNGLEALHGRAGKGSNAENVLHLGLKPGAIFITRDGKVMLGSYGLTRSPTLLPHGGVSGPVPARMEYLSPEQTHPDQKLSPASDVFSLGAILYELLTLEALFRADSNLQTIHKVRRAEVTTQLLRAKQLMPGLDKVLYRALSLNPRHRYQRAFVLREDLRGLMAGFSFANIADETRALVAPLLEGLPAPGAAPAPEAPGPVDSFEDANPTRIDADPMNTAQITAQALQARAAAERSGKMMPIHVEPAEVSESTESLLTKDHDVPTDLGFDEAPPTPDQDRPTLPGSDARVAEAVRTGLGLPPSLPFGPMPVPAVEDNEATGDLTGPDHTSFDALVPEAAAANEEAETLAGPAAVAAAGVAAAAAAAAPGSTSSFLAPTAPTPPSSTGAFLAQRGPAASRPADEEDLAPAQPVAVLGRGAPPSPDRPAPPPLPGGGRDAVSAPIPRHLPFPTPPDPTSAGSGSMRKVEPGRDPLSGHEPPPRPIPPPPPGPALDAPSAPVKPPTLAKPAAPAAAPPAPAPVPPTPVMAQTTGAFSRPMPGPGLSRPMPGPTLSKTGAGPVGDPSTAGRAEAPTGPRVEPPAPARADAATGPRPAPPPLAAPPPAAAPPVAARAPVVPVAAPGAPSPGVSARPLPRPVPPPPPAPAPADPFEEPRSGGGGLLFGGALVGMFGLVVVCAGVSWAAYSYLGSGTDEPAVASSEAAPADGAPAGDAADVMADAAPPTVLPMDPEQDAAAVLAAATPPSEPAPAAEPAPAEPPPAEPSPSATVAATTPPRSSGGTATSGTAASGGGSGAAGGYGSTASTAPRSGTTSTTRPTTTATRAPEPSREIAYTAPASTRTTTSTGRTSSSTYTPTVATSSYKPTTATSTTSTSRTATSLPSSEAVAEPLPDTSVAATPVSVLEDYVDDAKRGKLAADAVSTLEAVAIGDPQYTRSRALLLMNAQRRNDDAGTRKYLDQIMALPENRYNPVYLVDQARYAVNHGDFQTAIEKAQLAERYWARLPPELVFSKRAEIYEIEAAAWQGKFYKSGSDLELLEHAIRDWERYRDHVATRSRDDLSKRAEAQIAKLEDIKSRLE